MTQEEQAIGRLMHCEECGRLELCTYGLSSWYDGGIWLCREDITQTPDFEVVP